MNSNRRDLPLRRPYAGQAVDMFAVDAILGQRPDDGPFQRLNVPANILLKSRKIQYRIPDYLPGTMICYVPAAIGFMQRDAGALQYLGRSQHIFDMRIAAERYYMRMLDEEQLIANEAGLAVRDETVLQFHRLVVVHRP